MLRTLYYVQKLMRSQWYSGEKLERLQSRKFRRLVERAFNEVPYYRRLYAPEAVKKVLADGKQAAAHLPIITREELAQTPLQDRTSSLVNPRSCLKRTTSGSSGIPLVILEDKSSAAWWTAGHIRYLWAYGVRPGYKIAWLSSIQNRRGVSFLEGRLFKLTRPEPSILDLRDSYGKSFPQLVKLRPEVIIAPPSTLEMLMHYCEQNNAKLNPKIIAAGSEALTASLRSRVRDFFSAEVYDRYSAVETGNIAWECPSHVGYHVNVETVMLELANPKQATRSCLEGEAVVSCLYRHATPIIRYLLGDVVRMKDDECPCGRNLPLVESIQGRKVDNIKRRNGEQVSPYTVISCLDHIEGVRKFKVVQNADHVVDVFLVVSEDANEEVVADTVAKQLGDVLKDLPLRVKVVDSIPHGEKMKFKLVESHVS
ncbi:MAG: hypothetical protein NZ570_00025 [Candidatus Caldarchaeum sp.]|nr:hypothetical protein [Candidatus Caldarchaeum sp.]